MNDTPWRFSVLGSPAGFGHPWFLLAGFLALTAGFLSLGSALRRRVRVRQLVSPALAAALAPAVSTGLPLAKSLLSTFGLCLFAIALAEPQCGGKAELTHRRGIDVVVALDASKSMLAKDIAPNRLERAKLELLTLLDGLKGDRVGLVVFAGDAFVQCPMTSDYAAAKLFLNAVSPEQMPQGGTNIGAALRLSQEVLDHADRGAKVKVVVLLSDGEDLSGEVDRAVAGLREQDIKIYAVGIGSESGEPIPVYDARGEVTGYQKDELGRTVLTRLNRSALASLSDATGGEFFYEPRGVAMKEVIQRIDRLQKSDFDSRVAVRFDERFQFYALPGAILLWLGMALPSAMRRRA